MQAAAVTGSASAVNGELPMGRPRDLDARDRILSAAVTLVSTPGADASINAIVDAAGVGKATVYRWWSSRTAVVLDALRWDLERSNVELSSTGDPLRDIVEQLRHVAMLYQPPRRALVEDIIAAAMRGDDDAAEGRDLVIDSPRAALETVIRRAVVAGRLADDLDVEATAQALLGALALEVLATPRDPAGASDPVETVRRVLDTVLPQVRDAAPVQEPTGQA